MLERIVKSFEPARLLISDDAAKSGVTIKHGYFKMVEAYEELIVPVVLLPLPQVVGRMLVKDVD